MITLILDVLTHVQVDIMVLLKMTAELVDLVSITVLLVGVVKVLTVTLVKPITI